MESPIEVPAELVALQLGRVAARSAKSESRTAGTSCSWRRHIHAV
jgi:hypothetical protein